MAKGRPESKIAIARRITEDDVFNNGTIHDADIGRWAVVSGGGYIQLCDGYINASKLASSLNRSPA
jgi:hypothetical protein